MKETVKINLGGRLFDLDTDAYDQLKAYLDSLRTYFNSADETEEILDGIEERMADLLASKLSSSKQVVNQDDIQSLIDIMGSAEEMDSETQSETEEPHKEETKTKSEPKGNSSKRLYRDQDKSILGGVCTGLATYLNIDSIWIRLIFIALFFVNLIGVIIYLILWAVLPVARTAAQKLEMRGKPVNVDNIEREVKKEYQKVKDNFGKIKNSESYQKTRSTLVDILENLAKVLVIILKVIGVIIGVSLLFVVLGLIIRLLTGIDFHHPFGFRFDDFFHFPHLFHGLRDFKLFGFCVFLLVFIPILSLFIGFIRLILGSKRKNKIMGSFAATIWILALVTVIVLAINEQDHLALRKTKSRDFTINHPANAPLYINLDEFNQSNIEEYNIFNRQYAYNSETSRMMRKPQLKIIRSKDNRVHIRIERKHFLFKNGSEHRSGRRVSSYGWSNYDSLLVLDEYFVVRKNQGWRIPSIDVNLYIPEEKIVYLDRDLVDLLEYADTKSDYDYDEMVGRELKMTARGLEIEKQ